MSEHEALQSLQQDGSSTDEILRAMRDRGLTIIQAIKASMQLFGIGLGDAKSLVSSHPSWNQTAEAARPFQDDLIKAFREAGNVEEGRRKEDEKRDGTYSDNCSRSLPNGPSDPPDRSP